ncbi:MAG: phosphate ABC transporter permease PstA [Proteobacteria bacterium]|nr:phosphate ABC transporter permease PstA [Pseudomonadota bacterium]
MFGSSKMKSDSQSLSNGAPKPSVLFKTAVRIRSKAHSNATEGVPWIWVCAGALVTILLLIAGMFGIIIAQGISALWPKSVIQLQHDSQTVVGMSMRTEDSENTETGQPESKVLVYQANRDFGMNEFAFVPAAKIGTSDKPAQIWFAERAEWGPFIGRIVSPESAGAADLNAGQVKDLIGSAAVRYKEIKALEKGPLADLNTDIEELRLKKRATERHLELGELSAAEASAKISAIENQLSDLQTKHASVSEKVQTLRAADEAVKATLIAPNGQTKTLPASQLLNAYLPNQLSVPEKIGIFMSRLWSFVSDEPREANTEGGVFPALFGTVAMTLFMTMAVLPVGVMSAVYMREIAQQGTLVSLLRIAVNNLAGVPSIVYGIFGVGFFCYTVGVSVDQLFFQDKLPNPTFGTGGILWASLTLSLLTVPVVIVSTEEALSAVPRSLREASYGCGATRMQTLWNIVLPKAVPGVMTGLILAMARAVGEVAPLLMTGVVKLAPALPVDGHFPFFHLERSFMHLGFHIYDLGFQSRSTELSRPMVFASTSLLVGVVLLLNFVAIKIRSQLRKRFEGRGAF